VAAGEAAGTVESVRRGGGEGRELAARAGGAAKVVLNFQRALGLYLVRADVRVALETLVCEGRKQILGSTFNFFYRSRRLRVPICADFLATTHK
jgi:hypothetical protein